MWAGAATPCLLNFNHSGEVGQISSDFHLKVFANESRPLQAAAVFADHNTINSI